MAKARERVSDTLGVRHPGESDWRVERFMIPLRLAAAAALFAGAFVLGGWWAVGLALPAAAIGLFGKRLGRSTG